ncbi:olfactory receptor 4L1-like [Engraulis encrasicolus]|uniref:olfactory receptor 4L1-like n=1 Tax=Engraulis encrasicolus TaxID=184585 RepID=UPI002FCF73F0
MTLNTSGPMTVLILPPLPIPPSARLPVLVFSTLAYLITILCNAMVFASIVMNPNLHKPMYLLLINLPVCDMMGATAFFPKMISTMLSDPRVISHWECVLQAMFMHMYGGANSLILTVMALDRYVAICKPLSYHAIMTNSNVVKLIFKKESEAKRKALQTCGSHLVVFLFFQLNSFASFMAHRIRTTPLDVLYKKLSKL